MIIVTGATGQLGRAIVEKLIARVPATQIGANVRDIGKAADLTALGVRVRRGDFDDPESLPHAFEDAAQVLIVSSSARSHGGDTLTQHWAAIEAARAAGAGRIVYTSHMGRAARRRSPRCSTITRPKKCFGSPGLNGPRCATASMRRAAST